MRVVQVGQSRNGQSWRLLLEDRQGQEHLAEADVILDCSGVYGQPRWLGEGDLPARGERAARPHIPHGVVDILGKDRADYASRSVLVVGGGYSAASNVVALATLAEEERETWTFWVTHLPRGQPLPRLPADPLKERDRLAARANMLATRGDGHVEYYPQTVLDEVSYLGSQAGFHIAGRSQGKSVSWCVDRVIACVGYRPAPLVASGLSVSEGTYYILGAKAQPRTFLLADAWSRIQEVIGRLAAVPATRFAKASTGMKAA
jgi:hypothetical protein